jgi:hypothetical protein
MVFPIETQNWFMLPVQRRFLRSCTTRQCCNVRTCIFAESAEKMEKVGQLLLSPCGPAAGLTHCGDPDVTRVGCDDERKRDFWNALSTRLAMHTRRQTTRALLAQTLFLSATSRVPVMQSCAIDTACVTVIVARLCEVLTPCS